MDLSNADQVTIQIEPPCRGRQGTAVLQGREQYRLDAQSVASTMPATRLGATMQEPDDLFEIQTWPRHTPRPRVEQLAHQSRLMTRWLWSELCPSARYAAHGYKRILLSCRLAWNLPTQLRQPDGLGHVN